MLLLITFLSFVASASTFENIWDKTKRLSDIQKEELAINGVWIQGVRYIHFKVTDTESVNIPQDYSSYHQLSIAEKSKFQAQHPSLIQLINFIDPERFQKQRNLRNELRSSLRKSIDASNINLNELILTLHKSKEPIDSSVVDELLGLEYEKTEASIQGKYPTEAWMNQPKELSQTDYDLIRRIFETQPPRKKSIVYDLGSGYGRFGLYGGMLFPQVKFKGIELVRERVMVSNALADRLKLKNVSFYQQDVLNTDFSDGDYFYIFNSFPSIEVEVLNRLAIIAKKKKITVVCLGNIYKAMLLAPWLKQTKLLDQWQQLAVFESL